MLDFLKRFCLFYSVDLRRASCLLCLYSFVFSLNANGCKVLHASIVLESSSFQRYTCFKPCSGAAMEDVCMQVTLRIAMSEIRQMKV